MRPDGAATAALGPGRRANAMAAVDNDVVPQLSPSDRVKLLELAYNDRNALAEALRHLGFTKLGPRKRVELELLRKCHNRAPPPISLASAAAQQQHSRTRAQTALTGQGRRTPGRRPPSAARSRA